MADFHKIDRYFNDVADYNPMDNDEKSVISKGKRFVKLGFPCLAALIFGIMIVFPNIHKNMQITDQVTIPKKNEMEKLHMEQTVFNMTDAKNRVNKVFADNIDEVSPGSQKVKIIKPKGIIASDKGDINISSKIGYFNQNTHILDLENKVKTILYDGTIIRTNSATYDFNKEFGFGKEKIYAEGNWGKLNAESFQYDKTKGILFLLGNNFINTNNGNLSSEEKTIYYQLENKIKSYKNVIVTQKGKKIRSDYMIAYLNDGEKQEIKKAEFNDNVYIKTEKETITGDYGIYDTEQGKIEIFGSNKKQVEVIQDKNVMHANKIIAYLDNNIKQEIKKVEAIGNVYVITPKGSAKGDKGIYNPATELVNLYNNVVIEQNGNFIKGEYAETDLKTSVSRIKGNEKNKRISGIFYNKKKETKNGSKSGK